MVVRVIVAVPANNNNKRVTVLRFEVEAAAATPRKSNGYFLQTEIAYFSFLCCQQEHKLLLVYFLFPRLFIIINRKKANYITQLLHLL